MYYNYVKIKCCILLLLMILMINDRINNINIIKWLLKENLSYVIIYFIGVYVDSLMY